jgi:hypothetical protein
MSNVGESKEDAKASIESLFNAIPESRKMEYIGEYNEAMVYIERSTPGKSK